MYAWPARSVVNRRLPKDTLLFQAKAGAVRTSTKLREELRNEVERITVTHELSRKSINLPERDGYTGIWVIEIRLKGESVSDMLLNWIDQILPRATFFMVTRPGGIRGARAAFKRPSEADKSKWVGTDYFGMEWQADMTLKPLPVATNLKSLYLSMVRDLLPRPARKDEPIIAQIERIKTISKLDILIERLEHRIIKERQVNRRVALNEQLKTVRSDRDGLLGET